MRIRHHGLRRCSAAFVIIALIATVSGAPLSSAATALVQGTVTLPTGAAASGVTVEFHNGDGSFSASAVTNASGAYSFETGPASAQQLTVEVRVPVGYNRPANSPTNISYAPGMATQTVNFVLTAAPKTVTGRVTDTTGKVVGDADITIFPVGANGTGLESTRTAADGTFTKALAPGDWYINAVANLSEQQVRWINESVPVRLDFTDDSASQTLTQNFVVTPANGNLKVRLLNSDGSNLTTSNFTADISVRRADGIGTVRKVDTASSLNIWITPGIYTLSAFHTDLNGKSFDPEATTFVMTEGGTVDLGTITAQVNSAHLVGTVKSANGTTYPNRQVEAVREGGSERVAGSTNTSGGFDLTVGPGTWTIGLRTEAGANREHSQRSPAIATVANGQTISGLNVIVSEIDRTISGSVVNASGTVLTDFVGSVYVRTVNNKARVAAPVLNGAFTLSYSSTELAGSTVILGAQASPGSPAFGGNEVKVSTSAVQNITLVDRDATIRGTLRLPNGTAVANPGSEITVIGVDDDGNLVSAIAAADGTFALNVGQGTWLLDYEIEQPELTDGLLNRPAGQVKIQVNAGAAAAKDLTVLQGTNTITGTVLDADGNAVKRAHVTIDNRPSLDGKATNDANQLISATVETNDSGVYSAEVPNGTYQVTVGDTPAVDETQLPPDGKSIKVSGGSTTTANLSFEASDATITGKIKLSGKNEPGGTVSAYSNDGAQVTAPVGTDGSFTLNVTSKEPWHVVATDLRGGDLLASETLDLTPKKGANGGKTLTLKDTTIDVPGPVTKTFDADENGTIGLADGTTVTVPPFGIDTTGTVSLTVTPTIALEPTSLDRPATMAYEVKATDSQGREVRQLNREMTVTMPYVERALEQNGLNEKNLSPKFFNEQTGAWETDGLSGLVDKTDNVATFSTTHLTKFSTTGTPRKLAKAAGLTFSTQTDKTVVIEVAGSGFTGKPTALLGTLKSKSSSVSQDGKTLRLTFSRKTFKNGNYSLVLSNGDGRQITIDKALNVKSGKTTLKKL